MARHSIGPASRTWIATEAAKQVATVDRGYPMPLWESLLSRPVIIIEQEVATVSPSL